MRYCPSLPNTIALSQPLPRTCAGGKQGYAALVRRRRRDIVAGALGRLGGAGLLPPRTRQRQGGVIALRHCNPGFASLLRLGCCHLRRSRMRQCRSQWAACRRQKTVSSGKAQDSTIAAIQHDRVQPLNYCAHRQAGTAGARNRHVPRVHCGSSAPSAPTWRLLDTFC